MLDRTVAARSVLALVVLLVAWATPAAATDVVGRTSANLAWSPASGAVAGYGIFVSRNGGAYSATPDATSATPGTTVSGVYGDTLLVKVAAYDASGVYGPFSPVSDPIHFVPAPLPVIGLGTSALTAATLAGQSPASQSFTVANAGTGTLSYAISDDQAWLSVSPATGTSSGELDTITVSYATSGLAPGTYGATITVGGGTGVTSKTIPVGLTVTPAPTPAMALSAGALTASVQQGQNAAGQSFTIRNSGGGTLGYSLSDDASWLALTPATGTSTGEADTISVSFSTSGLAAGTYNATITASASGLPAKTLSVTLTVSGAPAIALSNPFLSASVQQGQNAASQSFTIRNSGAGTLTYFLYDNATWLDLTPATGTSTGEADTITVSFSTSSLPVGTYVAAIIAAGGTIDAQITTVSLVVTAATTPAMTLSRSALVASVQQGQNAAAQSFTIHNSGTGGTLGYSLSDDASWLSLSPAAGTSTGELDTIAVSFSTSGLAAGSYTATITASATGLAPQTVNVSLTVDAPPTPEMTLTTIALSTSVSQGASASPLSFGIRNSGTGGTLDYSLSDDATWLTLTPATGTSTGETDTIGVTLATTSLAAGSYSAVITASAAGVAAQTVTVSLSVTSGSPVIEVAPASLSANGVQGVDAPSVTFTIRNAGGGSLNWAVSDFQSWMSQSPAAGTSTGELDTVTVSFQSASRSAGTYSSTISVTAGGAATVTIPVTLTITQPAPARIETSLSSLSPAAPAGSNAASQSFTIRNAGGGALNWSASESASWLTLGPSSGTSTGEADTVTVTYATSALAAGTYTAPITISAAGVTSAIVNVTLTVGSASSLVVSTTTLGASATAGQNAAAQSFSVRSGSAAAVAWSATDDASWLSLSPATGSSSGEADTVAVSFASSGLAAGTYGGTITISGTGVASKTIAVALTIDPAGGASADWTIGASGDFDGDGKRDLLWHHTTSGANTITLMNGLSVLSQHSLPTTTSAYKPFAGDFDGDGKADLYWRGGTGENVIWILNGGALARTETLPALSGVWIAAGVGDTDRDGTTDVVFYNPNSGTPAIWIIAGGRFSRQENLPWIFSPWTIGAVGDFDGDEQADLFWHNPVSGLGVAWVISGGKFVRQESLPDAPSPWTPIGATDLSGDGQDDILLRDATTGAVVSRVMSGARFVREDPLPSSATDALLVGRGDFDGDGLHDLLWRRQSAGESTLWRMNGATRLGTVVSTTGP
jgi:uncharacterized membrane protein